MPDIDLIVNVSIIFLAIVASIFLLAGVFFILRLTKTLTIFSESVDPLFQKGIKIADNLESISGMIRGDIEEAHQSFSELLNGLKTASSQIEKRISEFTSLIGLVHTEMESAWLGLAGVLKFFGKKPSSDQNHPLESKPFSNDV